MEAELIIVKGKASKAKIPLKLPSVIGRSRKADMTIAHPMVSRRHCEVFEADGLLMVRDLDSLNGTEVAGQRIKEAPLPPDTELTVGPLTFHAHYEYNGDMSKLPEPVLAKPSDAPAADADVDSDDDADVGSDSDVPDLIVEEPEAASDHKAVAETIETPKQKAAADPTELPDDLFDEFLKGD